MTKSTFKKHQNSLTVFRVIVALLLFSTLPGQAQVEEIIINVNGLACPFCVFGLEKKLKTVEGVVSANAELQSGEARIELSSDAIPSFQNLNTAVEKAGFTPGPIRLTAKGRVTSSDKGHVFEVDHGKIHLSLPVAAASSESGNAAPENITQKIARIAQTGASGRITGILHVGGDEESLHLHADQVEILDRP